MFAVGLPLTVEPVFQHLWITQAHWASSLSSPQASTCRPNWPQGFPWKEIKEEHGVGEGWDGLGEKEKGEDQEMFPSSGPSPPQHLPNHHQGPRQIRRLRESLSWVNPEWIWGEKEKQSGERVLKGEQWRGAYGVQAVAEMSLMGRSGAWDQRLVILRWMTAPPWLGKMWRGLLRARLELRIRTLAVNDYTGLFRPCKLRFLGT